MTRNFRQALSSVRFARIAFAFLILLGVAACKPTVRVIGTWVTPDAKKPDRKKVKKVFINVMAQDVKVKNQLESDLADAAAKKGIESERSYFVFGPVRDKESLPNHDAIMAQIRKLGCDAIFLIAIIDQTTKEYYSPGSAVYSPYPAYGSFYNFYSYSSVVYTPGYYSVDKAYYITNNLYDTETEKLLVSMQTKVTNPTNIQKSSKEYTAALVAELEKQGYLKK